MQKLQISLIICLFITSGCGFPGVYKIDIQQGNIVTTEIIEKLKPGLTKEQVHFVMGTPVLTNTFDENHESYIYTIQLSGGQIYRQNITLRYEDNILAHIDAVNPLPKELANPGNAYKFKKKIKAGYFDKEIEKKS